MNELPENLNNSNESNVIEYHATDNLRMRIYSKKGARVVSRILMQLLVSTIFTIGLLALYGTKTHHK